MSRTQAHIDEKNESMLMLEVVCNSIGSEFKSSLYFGYDLDFKYWCMLINQKYISIPDLLSLLNI